MATNLAAVIPEAKAALEVRPTEKYTPGQGEVLVKNTVIAFNPVEWKIARLAIFPLQYPAILGSSYGGIVEAVGPAVTDIKIGDRVAVSKKGSSVGQKYGSHQRYVVATEDSVSKVPENTSIEAAASVIINLATVVGAFGAGAGLDRPTLDGTVSPKGKKILVYGGSSSVGSLAIQYAAQAGYTVVSTSSPRNEAFVSKLGAAKVVDHTQPQDAVITELADQGPYALVLDAISTSPTIAISVAILKAQGGGDFYRVSPAFGEESLPANIRTHFNSWPLLLDEPENQELKRWLFTNYLPQALEQGKIVPLPLEKVKGGLNGVSEALDKLAKGVSGVKLIANPWDE